MLLRLGHFACVLAFFAICGGHWAVLQTVAWAQMLRDYSEESGLVTAIQQTFSGERPCGMCVNITEGRQKEKQSPATVALAKKLEIWIAQTPALLRRPLAEPRHFPSDLNPNLPVRADEPPVPVPRFSLV